MSELTSNVASYSTFVRDTKRKARGDILQSTYMRDGVECEDTGLKYLIMSKQDITTVLARGTFIMIFQILIVLPFMTNQSHIKWLF